LKDQHDLETENQFAAFLFEEIRLESKQFLDHLSTSFTISRSQYKRALTAIIELVNNSEQNMAQPFFLTLLIAFAKNGDIIAAVENTAVPEDAHTALERLRQAVGHSRQSKLDPAESRYRFLDQPGDGGMGIWNIITQLKCDLWVRFDQSIQSVES